MYSNSYPREKKSLSTNFHFNPFFARITCHCSLFHSLFPFLLCNCSLFHSLFHFLLYNCLLFHSLFPFLPCNCSLFHSLFPFLLCNCSLFHSLFHFCSASAHYSTHYFTFALPVLTIPLIISEFVTQRLHCFIPLTA